MTTLPENPHHDRFLGSIRVQLSGIVVLFGIALIAIVAALAIWIDARDVYAGREDELRTVTEVAAKVVQQQYDEFKKGTISEEEAQRRAKASVRALRYNANDYFFVEDKNIITSPMARGPKQRGSIVRRHKIRRESISSSNSINVAAEKGAGIHRL